MHQEKLLEAMAPVTWRARSDGWAIDLASWCAYTGMELDKAQGWGWLEAVHPDDRERAQGVWKAAVERGDQYQVDYRIRTRAGDYRWFSVYGVPVLADDGEEVQWVGACVDVHDRVSMRERLESVMDNMTEALMTLDREWRVTYQNKSAKVINNRTDEEILGKLVYEEWPEVMDGPLEANYRKALAEQRPVRFEYRYHSPGEYDHWLEVQAVPTDDGGIGVFYLDISDRKNAETQVARSEARFRQLVDNLDAAFLLTDATGSTVHYASPFVHRLWGLASDDPIEICATLRERMHPEDRGATEALIWSSSDESVQTDYRLQRPDGRTVWVSHRRTFVRDSESKGLDGPLVAHIVTDITDRRFLEDQLGQSQRMESLGRLAGGVAHDFNNVLTVILGRASLLKLRLQGEEWAQASLDEIQAAAERASGITRQILAFAKRQEGEPVVLDLNRFLKRSATLLRRVLGEGIELVPLLRDDTPLIRLDPSQLDQILVNLAANAQAAMGDTGTFIVRTSRTELDPLRAEAMGVRPGTYARLDVEDTGSGIPPEIQAKIFDPFFTTREPEGGTGLGLATSYGLLSAAGGSLSVESEVGRGTTFTVLLPEVHGEAVELSEDAADSTLEGSERILVAEDEDRLQSLLVEVLETAGYQVTSVGNGPAALEHLRKGPGVELLITDVVMPGMSGVQLIGQARELEPSLRVLTMSGYRRGEDVPDTGLPEELAFLAKPFTPRELLIRVRSILDLAAGG